MKILSSQPLTTEEFVWILLAQERVMMPPVFCLSKQPVYRQYTVNSLEFLKSGVYSLWYTDPKRKKWVNPVKKDKSADKRVNLETLTPITFKEMLETHHLLDKKLEELAKTRKNRPKRPMPHAIAMHCSSCKERALLDGNAGFLRLCFSNNHQAMTITEVSSSSWADYMGKRMSGVCKCV